MPRKKFLFFLFLVPLLIVPLSVVRAGSEGAMENLQNFAEIAGVLQGFNPRGEVWRGQLTPGESVLISETFLAGNEYLVLAAGDAAATNLDLELFDVELNLLDADYGEDSTPLVSITPTQNETFYLRVTLISSQGPAAWYALQVMYR